LRLNVSRHLAAVEKGTPVNQTLDEKALQTIKDLCKSEHTSVPHEFLRSSAGLHYCMVAAHRNLLEGWRPQDPKGFWTQHSKALIDSMNATGYFESDKVLYHIKYSSGVMGIVVLADVASGQLQSQDPAHATLPHEDRTTLHVAIKMSRSDPSPYRHAIFADELQKEKTAYKKLEDLMAAKECYSAGDD